MSPVLVPLPCHAVSAEPFCDIAPYVRFTVVVFATAALKLAGVLGITGAKGVIL
jgi:hypothetical protein